MDEDYQAAGAAGTKKVGKQHNTLPIWGNEASMNLNPLILANIQGSSYFKVHLFKLKTYHEVVDEIYYQVKHMEPWERGSRKTSGQTGMCGGVRGVGAGGIVSTAYCLLYKLYTLRLTRKQVNGLLNHTDSPYIRALGFMYLRYTQPPGDLYDWYEDYLQDEEEIDVKAGGGQVMTIGQMVYQFLTKLDWFSTLFPRIPVPMQKQIEKRIEQYCRENQVTVGQLSSARIVGNAGNAAAAPYEGDFGDRRGGGGNGSAGGSRSAYGRHDIPPPPDNYRSEHDDRGGDPYHSGRSAGRRDNYSPSLERKERSSDRSDRYHHSDKHKKKHKHKHRSRSRSRGHSRSRTPPSHSRSGSRSRSSEHHRRKRDKHYERDYAHRKYS